MSVSSHIVPVNDVVVKGKATLVLEANAFRIRAIFVNHSVKFAVRWGDKSVSAQRGARLKPGGTREIPTRGPVWMASEGDDAVVSCTEDIR